MADEDRKQQGNIPVIRIDDDDLADLSSLLGEPVAARPAARPAPRPAPAARPPAPSPTLDFDDFDPDEDDDEVEVDVDEFELDFDAEEPRESSAPRPSPAGGGGGAIGTGGVVHIDVGDGDDDFEALLQRTLGEAAGTSKPSPAPPPSAMPASPKRSPRAWSGPPPPRGGGAAGNPLQRLADARAASRRAREERHQAESKVIDDLRKKVKDLNTETEKYRKRIAAEAEGARTKGRSDVLKNLMPVIDTLELALKSAKESRDVDALINGIELCFKQLFGHLRQMGFEDIHPEGEQFDPVLHEAFQQLRTGQAAPGTIVGIIRRGYKVGDQLLRPAQVVVEAG